MRLLGYGYTCKWNAEGDILEVLLGTHFSANVGQNLTVLSNTVANATGAASCPFNVSVKLQPPVSSNLRVQITGPTILKPCQAATFQALILSGRDTNASYLWKLESVANTSNSLVQFVSIQTSPFLILSGTNFSVGLHNLSVTVTDVFGFSNVSWFTFNKTSFLPPEVSLQSPQVITGFRTSSSLSIYTKVLKSACPSAIQYNISAMWRQAKRGSPYIAGNLSSFISTLTDHVVAIPDPRSYNLKIPAYALKPGHMYGFILTVKSYLPNGHLAAASNESLIVKVQNTDVVVQIKGGSKRTLGIVVGSTNVFSFDATDSYDPDNLTYPLQYKWQLYSSSAGSIVDPSVIMTLPVLNIPSSAVSPDQQYIVSVNVTGQPAATGERRMSSASQIVLTISRAIPTVTVTANTSYGSKHNTNEKLIMTLQVASHTSEIVSYLWSTSSPLLNLSDPSVRRSSITGESLVLASNVLQPGETYEFSASVTDAEGEVGSAYLTIIANSGPSQGTCYSIPTSGVALTDTFRFACTGWSDEDLPILYRFQCYQNVSNSLQLSDISEYISSEYLDTVLPPPPATASNLTIVATIKDGLNATTSFTFQVKVSQITNLDTNATSKAASDALDSGDVQTFTVLVSGMASYLKSGSLGTVESVELRSALLSDVDSLAQGGGFAAAAQLVNALTDYTSPADLDAAIRSSALSTLATISEGFGSESTAPDESTAKSALSALGNIVGAEAATESSASGSIATSDGSHGSRVEGILASLSSALLRGAAIGEDPVELATSNVVLVSQLQRAENLGGISLSASSGGKVEIPSDLPVNSGSIAMSMSSIKTSLYPVDSNATGLVIVELRQDGVEIASSQSEEGYKIVIPLTGYTAEDVETMDFSCRYWDPATLQWSTDGLSFVNASIEEGLTCVSKHLTAFNGDASVEINVNAPTEVELEAFSLANPVMAVCVFVFCGYLTVVVIGFYIDLKVSASQGNAASDSFWRNSNNFRMSRITAGRSFLIFRKMSCWGLRRKHPWFSIYGRHHGDYINSVKRASILLCLLFNTMAICALLLDQDQKLPFLSSNLANAFVSMAFCFPVPFLMGYLHKREVPERFKIKIMGKEQATSAFGYILLILGLVCGELMWEDMGGGDEGEEEGGEDEEHSHENGFNTDMDDEKDDGENDDDDEVADLPAHHQAASILGLVTAGAVAGAESGAVAGAAIGLDPKNAECKNVRARKREERRRILKEKRQQLREVEMLIEQGEKDRKLHQRLNKLREEVLNLPDEDDISTSASSSDDEKPRKHFKFNLPNGSQKNDAKKGAPCVEAYIHGSTPVNAGTTMATNASHGKKGGSSSTHTKSSKLPYIEASLPGFPQLATKTGTAPFRLASQIFSDAELVKGANDRKLPTISGAPVDGKLDSKGTSVRKSNTNFDNVKSKLNLRESTNTLKSQLSSHPKSRYKVQTVASLARIRNDIKRDIVSLKTMQLSAPDLDTKAERKPFLCICGCKVLPRDTPNLSTHIWTWHDVFGVTFEIMVVLGCWFLLVVLSWQLNESGTISEFTLTTSLAFSQDIAFRILQILVLEAIMFIPCCYMCMLCFCPCRAFGDKEVETEYHYVNFDSGFLGMEYRKCRVVNVLQGSQADTKGVLLGMLIREVHRSDTLKIFNLYIPDHLKIEHCLCTRIAS